MAGEVLATIPCWMGAGGWLLKSAQRLKPGACADGTSTHLPYPHPSTHPPPPSPPPPITTTCHRHRFESVPLRSELRVALLDRRGRLGLDARPLGSVLLPAAAVPASDGPVFLWLPLAPPGDEDDVPLMEVRLGRRNGCAW